MADAKISALTAVAPATSTDELAVNEAGVSKKVTVAQLTGALALAVPTVVSVGTEFHSTAVPTATLPGTHTTNDILLLLIQSGNDSQVAAPAGYAKIGPQNGVGLAAAAGSTKLSLFWKRDGGSESAPTLVDTGDHTYGVMIAIRGCTVNGDPFKLLGNAFKFATSTTGTSPAGATATDNCLILDIWGHAIHTAGQQGSGGTNAGLTSVTEQFDGSTTDGTSGGGIYVLSGILAQSGSIAASTITWAATTVDVSTRLAFTPVDSNQINSSPPITQIQTFIGSGADLDDVWVKPSGARKVFVQICDGGGGGSGGNIATTAEGGGGGGGGGYDEAWYNADDLAATISVHAGKGGAIGTGLNLGGTTSVISEFDKAGSGPLTSAYRIAGLTAIGAASANGGDGGCGSGRGVVSGPSYATTRITLEGIVAGAAFGGRGGAGGSGTTAPVGGSPSEWGGGGGESGADTDAGIIAGSNGYSLRGAGGGSGGRTNTLISIPGSGGAAAAPTTPQGAAGTNSTRLPFGGSGGVGGGSSVVTGGAGGFPGGGGGGGAGVAGGFGGKGGDGCIVVTTFF